MRRLWSDRRMELIIAYLLRGGVILSAVFVLAGGVLYLIRHGTDFPCYGVFRGEPSDLRNLRGIISNASTLRSRGLIAFGLLLLIATPVARVGFSILAFLQQRDRTYVLVTLIVFVLLLYSLFDGMY